MKHLKWVAFIAIVLFVLFVGVSPAAAQDGETAASGFDYPSVVALGGLLSIVAMILFTFFHEWDSNRRTAEMIKTFQQARNDTLFLDRIEKLAVHVVPAELLVNVLNLVKSLTTDDDSRRLVEEVKGLIRQITDGEPNEPAHPHLLTPVPPDDNANG